MTSDADETPEPPLTPEEIETIKQRLAEHDRRQAIGRFLAGERVPGWYIAGDFAGRSAQEIETVRQMILDEIARRERPN